MRWRAGSRRGLGDPACRCILRAETSETGVWRRQNAAIGRVLSAGRWGWFTGSQVRKVRRPAGRSLGEQQRRGRHDEATAPGRLCLVAASPRRGMRGPSQAGRSCSGLPVLSRGCSRIGRGRGVSGARRSEPRAQCAPNPSAGEVGSWARGFPRLFASVRDIGAADGGELAGVRRSLTRQSVLVAVATAIVDTVSSPRPGSSRPYPGSARPWRFR